MTESKNVKSEFEQKYVYIWFQMSLQNSVWKSMSWSSGGRLFHTRGAAVENAQSQSFVCAQTPAAALVIADLRYFSVKSLLKSVVTV